MLTSWSEVSTPAELSIASVLMRRRLRVLDPAELGEAEVAALADDAAAQLARRRRAPRRWPCRRRRRWSRWTPSRRCRCRRSRAGRPAPQDRADQLGGRHRVTPARCRARRAPRGVIGIDLACAGRRRRPGRSARGRSRPTTSAAARTAACARRTTRGVGIGSRKMCRWSNAATSRMCCDSSMPLPNTSPDMSPMPTTVKSCGLGVDAELAEVPLHRLPRAAGGDAHRLVVVADRAAGRERVAEPEAVRASAISLAMSENVAVPLSAATTRYGSSPSWRTTAAAARPRPDEVVGDVEQPAMNIR
jgi:hypothetical protein